jgi:ComF family protein
VLPHLVKIKGAALNLLFPHKCLGCGREGELVCTACRCSLPAMSYALCPRCGRPQLTGVLCPECIVRPWHIDGIRAPFKFEGLARECVHQLKYKNLRSLSAPLSRLLFEYFNTHPLPAEVIVPVPLHPRRLNERGYNQSALLARGLSKLLGLPLDEEHLARRKYLQPQAKTASAAQRRENVERAFVCHPFSRQPRVLLIDDVSTSGATLDACAHALKSAGASSVWGLVFAREI